MKHFVVLFSVLAVAIAAPGNFSSFHTEIGGRIVGGVQADIRELPYQAALLRNGAQICGAAIIGPDTILTAAHCVAPSVISNIRQLNFRVGSSQWRSGGQRIASKRIIIHELYQDCDTCSPDYDIAIVKLAEKINAPLAASIPLVSKSESLASGTYVTVSGWGHTVFNAPAGAETLRKVNLPTVSNSQCRSVYGSIITNRVLCAGYNAGGKDSCQGDSGGPLAVNGKLAGIVSFGFRCAEPRFPGVYSSVAGFRDWIKRHSGI